MIARLAQGSTTKGTGARLDSASRSRAQRPLEQSSTGMIGAMLDDRLVGAWLDCRQPRVLELGSTVLAGAGLNGPWSNARQE